ncbi:MAG: SH3 domain-containing protein [Pseudomonadota bacterium]
MRRAYPMLILLLLGSLIGCKDTADSATTTVQPTPGTPPTEPAEPASAAAKEEFGLVRTGLASLKETPEDKGKWKATMMRGEKVTVLDRAPGHLKVRLSDGTEGFVDDKAVLTGEVQEVLVLDDKPLYQRPDSASLRDGTVKLGTLLFILRDKDGWLEVQLPKGRTGWMQSADISRDQTELAVARNLFRHELLRDAKQKARQEQAAQILAETISQYPQSRVLQASGLAPGAAPTEDKPADAEPNADMPAEGAVAADINAVEPAAAPVAPPAEPAPAPAPAAAPAAPTANP